MCLQGHVYFLETSREADEVSFCASPRNKRALGSKSSFYRMTGSLGPDRIGEDVLVCNSFVCKSFVLRLRALACGTQTAGPRREDGYVTTFLCERDCIIPLLDLLDLVGRMIP